MSEQPEDPQGSASAPDGDLMPLIRDNLLQGRASVEVRERETSEERASRLKREEEDAKVKRWKDLILFVIALLATVGIIGTTLWLIVDPNPGPDTKAWAMSIIAAIMGGFGGFVTGKGLK